MSAPHILHLPWIIPMSFYVQFQCCGVDGYTDFNSATKWTKYNNAAGNPMQIPPTCCKLKDSDAFLKDQTAELVDNDCPWNPSTTNSNQNTVGPPCSQYLFNVLQLVFSVCVVVKCRPVLHHCLVRFFPEHGLLCWFHFKIEFCLCARGVNDVASFFIIDKQLQ